MDQKNQPRPSDAKAGTGKRFAQMTSGEKVMHVGKVVVFLFTFGFAFPNIFSD